MILVQRSADLRIGADVADCARFDTHDADDVRFLVKHLELKKPREVFKIVENFYPGNRVPPKTQYFIEEIVPEKTRRRKPTPRP